MIPSGLCFKDEQTALATPRIVERGLVCPVFTADSDEAGMASLVLACTSVSV